MDADAMSDGESRSVQLPADADGHEGFVVRQNGGFFGYINRCPHTGAPLDWMPDEFLDADGSYIICAVHGALFEIDSGFCVAGPCASQSLVPLKLSIANGSLVLHWPG